MGAGASSHTSPSALNRLRKALVMRAYNIRQSDETLGELFRPHAYRSSNVFYISVSAVKKTLAEDAPWVDLLFEQVVGHEVGDLEFNSFIHFLETGHTPSTKGTPVAQPSKEPAKSKYNINARPPTDLPPSRKKGGLPPTPPRNKPPVKAPPKHSSNMSRHIPTFNPTTSTVYPGVISSLHLHTLAIGIHSGAVVPSTGLTVSLDSKSSYRDPSSGPTRPLWRKREVVKHERTVEYTTIDAEGVTQVGASLTTPSFNICPFPSSSLTVVSAHMQCRNSPRKK